MTGSDVTSRSTKFNWYVPLPPISSLVVYNRLSPTFGLEIVEKIYFYGHLRSYFCSLKTGYYLLCKNDLLLSILLAVRIILLYFFYEANCWAWLFCNKFLCYSICTVLGITLPFSWLVPSSWSPPLGCRGPARRNSGSCHLQHDQQSVLH